MATAAATSSQTRTRPLSASQRASAASQGSGWPGGSGLARSRKRQALSFFTPPRSGSARTADAAASTRAASRRGDPVVALAAAACPHVAMASAAIAARAHDVNAACHARAGRTGSAREGKAKLLLDVPRFELDAPVQVHREAVADEE